MTNLFIFSVKAASSFNNAVLKRKTENVKNIFTIFSDRKTQNFNKITFRELVFP